MTTEREQAIRDCIAALPHSRPTGVGDYRWLLDRDTMDEVRGALFALLSTPDQAEASSPSQSAGLANAPVDHGPAAGGDGEAGTLCERTVRACIDAVPNKSGMCKGDVGAALLALILPKPDKAKELVEAYLAHLNVCCVLLVTPQDVATHFARWLFETGRLAE